MANSSERAMKSKGESPERKARKAKSSLREEEKLERVTPELYRAAGALRAIFDIQPYDPARAGEKTELTDRSKKWLAFYGAEFPQTKLDYRPARAMLVRAEFAEAIRTAIKLAQDVWISFALEDVTAALVGRDAVGRGGVDRAPSGVSRPATTASAIYETILVRMRNVGLTFPPHVDERVVEWMLAHLAVGAAARGARSTLSPRRMRDALATPQKLAKAMASAK